MAEERLKRFTKKRIALCTAVVLFAAVIGLLVANHDSTPMPVYQGKTAKEWLYNVSKTNQGGANEAFREMGSNAVPFLVHEMVRDDSAGEKFYRRIYGVLPAALSRRVSEPVDRRDRVSNATFALLNSTSPSAIPLLLPILSEADPERQFSALRVLSFVVGPDDTNCLTPVTSCLSSKDYSVCIEAAGVLEKMNRAELAITSLSNFLRSTNSDARINCLFVLSHIDSTNSAKWAAFLTNDPEWKTFQSK